MTVLQIYERVELVAPTEQRRFFDAYNDTVSELCSMYSPLVFTEEETDAEDGRRKEHRYVTEADEVRSLSDEITVRPLYHEAIADNILYKNGAGDGYRAAFLEKAHKAWLEYYRRDAKGARVRRRHW